ncbi:MAG TPA: FHA domain-containing protein [Baekduia sp.]|nr:FHA domain-containing protein [Baekduia sp.]
MPPLRASDRLRAGTIAALRRGYLEGQLSTQTFEARVAVAQEALRRRTLRALLADLRVRSRALHALSALVDERAAGPLLPRHHLRTAPVQATILLSRTALTEVTVGRASSATVTFGSAAVSRHHARFERVAGQWYVTDLSSTNGTFVDGVRVERAPIAAEAQVRLGDAYLLIG